MTNTMKSRPNSNYILAVMRDDMWDDPWGTAMSWAFACAETLTVLGEDVPQELEYRPSPFVMVEDPETYEPESYEDREVWEYLLAGALAPATDRIADVKFAGRCLSRYIDWCRQAGLNY